MRDINFLAWDIARKVVHKVYRIAFSDEGEEEFSNEEIQFRYQGEWQTLDRDEYILMQCTGLCDKNGKKGYASYIVSFGSTRPRYLIEWCVCNACFRLVSMDERAEVLGINNLIVGEIISNIHENPELLEQSQ